MVTNSPITSWTCSHMALNLTTTKEDLTTKNGRNTKLRRVSCQLTVDINATIAITRSGTSRPRTMPMFT